MSIFFFLKNVKELVILSKNRKGEGLNLHMHSRKILQTRALFYDPIYQEESIEPKQLIAQDSDLSNNPSLRLTKSSLSPFSNLHYF